MKESQKPIEDKPVVVRIEQLSFEIHGTYMDVVAHADYVDITIGGTDWKIINEQVTKLLKQG